MLVDDLDYPFDDALIAREPVTPRDAARLLVYTRRDRSIEHAHVRDLPRWLAPGDALVVNETTVAPARIRVRRATGALIEGLLLERRGPRRWRALLKNGKALKPGERAQFLAPATDHGPSGPVPIDEAALVLVGREGEGFVVELEGGGAAELLLERVGWTALPPYILQARATEDGEPEPERDRLDRARYQTVYANDTTQPSVAAPTAGLHFTEDLLARIASLGVERIGVSLQVGAGTFKPVETERLEDHPMHHESCIVSDGALARLRAAAARRALGTGRIVAVGTTSVRTLESLPRDDRGALPERGPLVWSTNLLLAPGARIGLVDALMTNFHLPRSTLIALVAAFVGLDETKRIYAVAQAERYRFYSFGDAMLVL
jgi:S-adenosylmethionine:tRNA ribosyltransferase-isomerase